MDEAPLGGELSGESESIEVRVCVYPKSLMHTAEWNTSPAGIEPTFKV